MQILPLAGLRALLALVISSAAAVGSASYPPAEPMQPAGFTSLADNPFAGQTLYVDPDSNAARTAAALRTTDPAGAALFDKVARGAQADWLGGWTPTSTVASTVSARVRTITAAHAMPVFVIYDIPERDCHSYSGGGASSPAAYRAWVDQVALGIGTARTAVIVEPDALAQLGCLSAADQSTRLTLLRYAVDKLAAKSNVAVYVDAGHAGWIDATTMAKRLIAVDVKAARGFSLNVSNYDATASEVAYGRAVMAQIGWKRFVIDTSRNGLGSNGEWCNATGRALGALPGTPTGDPAVDAYLWVKRPGESDGTCNGGPTAGTWWPDYARGLASRATW